MEFFDNTCWKKEAASNKRSTKRVFDTVARILETHVMAENELPACWGRASQKNLIDTYELLEIRKTSYPENNNNKSRKLIFT